MSKEYFSKYLADDRITQLNRDLVNEILKHKPNSVFEFGAGQGKNLKLIHTINPNIALRGIDISSIAVSVARKKGIYYVAIGDENTLLLQPKFDVSFTCSCLDHIEHEQAIKIIIEALKRMSNIVILLETQRNTPDSYYYYHDYEKYGFKKLDYEYYSDPKEKGDGSYYNMFRYEMS